MCTGRCHLAVLRDARNFDLSGQLSCDYTHIHALFDAHTRTLDALSRQYRMFSPSGASRRYVDPRAPFTLSRQRPLGKTCCYDLTHTPLKLVLPSSLLPSIWWAERPPADLDTLRFPIGTLFGVYAYIYGY